MEATYRHGPASASAYGESPPASPPISLSARTSSRGFQQQRQRQQQKINDDNAGGSGSPGFNGMSSAARTRSGTGESQSPPRTPPPRHLRGQGKQRRVDQVLEGGEEDSGDNPRHSHGLSWNLTTRDSVVDNLLFSLDNLSRGDVEAEEQDNDRHQFLNSLTSAAFTMGGPSRTRGHTHSSSASDSTASPTSDISATPKERRSNSSTHFSLHTERGGGHGKANVRVNGIPETHADESVAPPDILREDKNSLQQALGSRLGWNGKSASMDNMHIERSADGLSVLTRGRPVPSVHSKYDSASDADAAPEPIVAAGPRKMQNPTATGPVYVNPAPKTQAAASSKAGAGNVQKVTTQTDLRSANSTQGSLLPQDVRNQAADFIRTSSMRGSANAPPVPAQTSPAPSPDVVIRRRDPSPPREKQGFFKRVFGGGGGSLSRAASNPADRQVSKQVAQDATDRTDATIPSKSQASAGNPPRVDTKQTMPPTTPSHPPPSLNKKPSSFFRRRKKSTSESIVPPPLPTHAIVNANTHSQNKMAEPSPSISSLRKVMNPFLNEEPEAKPGATSQQEVLTRQPSSSRTENSEDLNLFHSGYTPPLDTSLHVRHPLSREQSTMQMSDHESSSPVPKMKLKKRRPDASETPRVQLAASNGHTHEPANQASIATLQEHANAQPKVSPISTNFPHAAGISKHAGDVSSRPSTGDRIIASLESSPIERPGDQDLREFSAGTNVSLSMDDEPWGVVTNLAHVSRPESKNAERLLLRPTPSEEKLQKSADAQISPWQSVATSPVIPSGSEPVENKALLPVVQVDGGNILEREPGDPSIVKMPSTLADEDAEYKERARKIFDGDEEDVVKAEAAAWMGERNPLSTKTLEAYMQLFDFSGKNVLAALRMLCNKLVLRGETQQFDRIITALSSRWCGCNPSHGFKAKDVIHCICYSLILLNTDLHLADIGEKMSRSAYVKNTLPTIKRVVSDAAPNAFEDTLRPTMNNARPGIPWTDSFSSMSSPVSPLSDTTTERPDSLGIEPSTLAAVNTNVKRLSIRPTMCRIDSDTPDSAAINASNALVNSTWTGTMRGWEGEVETVLKFFYTSIKADPLPLHGTVMTDLPLGSNRNLSVVDLSGSVRRSGSIISKAPSDNMSYRSKGDLRSMTMRWQSRNNRPRPKLYPASTIGSSRTSFDDGSGFWSPAQSSKYSFNKTLTSPSVGSFGYADPFKHSIGFANALSEAIIREENTGSGEGESFTMPGRLLEDESLALEGAPWAKEGLVKHKHHLETPARKAKERSWNDCFAVVSKGKLTLFAFNTSSSKTHSNARKPFYKGGGGKAASVTGTRVGGGDWMENAEQLDTFVLRQTIASTLPPPGYSKTRPHVWALSLPSGAVHLFQVGTPDIAEEFISAANYWSARLSKEPLSGGVSNVEYGWSEKVINTALVERSDTPNSPPVSMQTRPMGHNPSLSTERARTSLQSSIRGSFDTAANSFGGKAKLPGDKAQLIEWQPPSQSMMASQLLEVDQLRQLTAYVDESERELQRHQGLKTAIELAFSPRHPNHHKAMANWQRKSDYLLREIIKFRTYIDALQAAEKCKERLYARNKVEGEGERLSPVVKDDLGESVGDGGGGIGRLGGRGIHTSG